MSTATTTRNQQILLNPLHPWKPARNSAERQPTSTNNKISMFNTENLFAAISKNGKMVHSIAISSLARVRLTSLPLSAQTTIPSQTKTEISVSFMKKHGVDFMMMMILQPLMLVAFVAEGQCKKIQALKGNLLHLLSCSESMKLLRNQSHTPLYHYCLSLHIYEGVII